VLFAFWHITCPCCARSSWSPPHPHILTFNYSDLIFVLTGGGPPTHPYHIDATPRACLFEPRVRMPARSRVLLVVMLVLHVFYCASPNASRKTHDTPATPKGTCRVGRVARAGRPWVWIGLVRRNTRSQLCPFIGFYCLAKGRPDLVRHAACIFGRCHPTFENYVRGVDLAVTPCFPLLLNIPLGLLRSLMVATTVLSVLAGYAIARSSLRRRLRGCAIFFATQMF